MDIFLQKCRNKKDFSAKGLKEASEKLDEMKLNEKEAKDYKRYLKELRNIASDQHTKMADAQDLILAEKKGEDNKETETILKLSKKGLSNNEIAEWLDISLEKVNQTIRKPQK